MANYIPIRLRIRRWWFGPGLAFRLDRFPGLSRDDRVLRNAPVETAQPVDLRVQPRARVQLVRFEKRPQAAPLRLPRLAAREAGHDIDELEVEHVAQLGAQRVVVQRAEVHAAVEDDLADRRRAEEVEDRLEVGGGEVGNVDEIRAGVGGCAAKDDDG